MKKYLSFNWYWFFGILAALIIYQMWRRQKIRKAAGVSAINGASQVLAEQPVFAGIPEPIMGGTDARVLKPVYY